MATRRQRTKSSASAQFLAEASRALASSFELSQTLPKVAQLAVPSLADCCIIELIGPDGRSYFPAAAFRRAGAAENLRDQMVGLEHAPGTELVLDRVPAAWWEGLGLKLLAIEPIETHGQRIGVLALARLPTADGRNPLDRDLIRELSLRVATAVDNAQRFMRERRVARSFQTALLPTSFPKFAGRSFHASYAPASDEAEVGGDWYDAFDLPDGRLAMSIGDVAGHGLEAAVIMGEVRQTFRVAAMENRDPGAVLDMANRLLLLRPEPIMVTAIFGTYDGHTLTYASAGHPPPIIGTVEGGVNALPIDGIPLGVEAGQGRRSWTVTIPPGSMLVMYTDGLIEFGRDALEGEQRLLDAVRSEMAEPSEDPARSIRQRVLANKETIDDVALLTFTVDRAPMPELDLRYTAAPVSARLVRQAVSRFAADTGLTQEQQFALNVAIGEAVNNIIEHAYLRAPGMFSVRVRREDHKIVIVVEDAGNWRQARREGRGRGLPVMRALMNSVEVNLSQGGTVIKMVFDLNGRVEKERSAAAGR
jgi:serine phosphatase RsbU (regulator of sigma subunit)/anti-sigma regulatory factor (Ser/Thr protein kinase)